MITCGYCGYQSTLDEYFVEKAITNRPPAKVCPGCVEKLDTQDNSRTVTSYLVMLVLGSISVYLIPNFAYGVLVLNLVTMMLLLWISLFLHELAHYFAGIYLGGTVPLVQIGTGPLLKRLWIAGTTWEIRAHWFSGCVYSGFSNKKFSLTKCFLIYAAGPIINIMLIAFTLILMNTTDDYLIFEIINIPLALIVANVLLLFPSRSTFGMKNASGPVSDARRMFEIISGKYPNKKNDYDQTVFILQLRDLAFREQSVQGLKVSREALSRFPDLYLFRFYEAAFLSECENYDLAIEKARKALKDLVEEEQEDDIHAKIHAVLLKLCIADAINEDPSNMDYSLALELSNLAFEAMPWNWGVLMVHGKALAAIGEKEEALRILERALTFEMSNSKALEVSSLIGLICHELGKNEKATDWLNASRKYKGTNIKQDELEELLNA